MELDKSTFQSAFTYLYFLMLSADKIADLKELTLGNKIITLEDFDKTEVMKEMDQLSAMPRDTVYERGLSLLKSLTKENQLKVLAYVKMIAKVDGSYDEKESSLLNEISINELRISLQEVFDKEQMLSEKISNIGH